MVNVPVRVPDCVGLNVTPMAHFDAAPTLGLQALLDTAKSPLAVTDETLNDDERWFVIVTVLAALVVPTAWLTNVSLAGARLMVAEPVPLKLTVCGLLSALSVNVSVPVCAPVAVGEKVTPTLHVAPAAMLDPQVLLAIAKFVLAAMFVNVSALFCLFVSAIDFAALVFPAITVPKASLAGTTVTGAIPVPVTVTDASTSFDVSLTVIEPDSAPRTVGANDTLILHVAPAAILPAHVLLWVKYSGAAITTACADVPVFFTVTVLAALVLPSAKFPNASVDGAGVMVADRLELALTRRRTVVRIQETSEIDRELRPTTAEARIETPEIVFRVLVYLQGELVLGGGGSKRGNSANC